MSSFTIEIEYPLEIDVDEYQDVEAILFAEVYYSHEKAVIRMDPDDSFPAGVEARITPLILTYKNQKTGKLINISNKKKIEEIAGTLIRKHESRMVDKAVKKQGDR